jgi:multiple sugar transport system substrate-binding protein
MSEPKKVDRRKFIYAGLGAVALIAIGAAAYVAMNPPVVTQTVPTTSVVTTTVPTTSVVTTTVPTTSVVTSTTTSVTVGPKRKLSVWSQSPFVPPQTSWQNEKCMEWGNKNNVEVEVTYIPGAEFWSKLTVSIEAGNPPDLVIKGVPAAILAERGKIVPIDDVIEKLGKDDIYPQKLKEASYKGRYYFLPNHFEIAWYHIRKDLFKKAGVDLPKSLEELLDVSRKVNQIEKGVYGFGIPFGMKSSDAIYHLLDYVYQFGGGIAKGRSPADVLINVEPYRSGWRKGFQYLKTFWDEKLTPPDSPEWTDASNNTAYINGAAAIVYNPPSIWYALMTQKPELAAVTTLWTIPGHTLDMCDEYAYVINGPNSELAKDLLYYVYGDKGEYLSVYCKSGGYYALPIFRSQMETVEKEWKNGTLPQFTMNPKEAAENTSGSVLSIIQPLGEADPVFQTWWTGWKINEFLQRAVVKGEDLDKLIDEMQQAYISDLKSIYKL